MFDWFFVDWASLSGHETLLIPTLYQGLDPKINCLKTASQNTCNTIRKKFILLTYSFLKIFISPPLVCVPVIRAFLLSLYY